MPFESAFEIPLEKNQNKLNHKAHGEGSKATKIDDKSKIS